MLLNALSPLAFLALAGHAIAEPAPQPYQMNVGKMSVKDIFGLQRRDDGEYQPTETLCGSGTTCAEACGQGFEQCGSQDDQVHCFNPTVGQKCCQGGTNGNACDDGYYCANDGKGATWCCKDGDEACGGKIPASLISSTSVATATTSSPSASPTTSSPSASPTTSSVNPAAVTSSSSSYSSTSSSSSSTVSSTSPSSNLVVAETTTSFAAAITSQPVAANCTTYTTEFVVPISAHSTHDTNSVTSASKSYVSPTLSSASSNATNSPPPVTASSNDQRPVIAFVLGAAALVALAL
ncbi:hypothetical protein PG994_000212 [Apiospora phragmitis]|uniref:Uncharacterized protein n=1 Tax=Apiospora phragmitis TaxID=2905665 RepID=A0ABR1X5T9_9PEZI